MTFQVLRVIKAELKHTSDTQSTEEANSFAKRNALTNVILHQFSLLLEAYNPNGFKLFLLPNFMANSISWSPKTVAKTTDQFVASEFAGR